MKKAVISRRYLGVVFIVLAMAIIPAAAMADLIFPVDTLINATPPPDPTPWVTATFHDVSSGVVDLTLTVNNLSGSEHLDHWLFNVADDTKLGNLVFSLISPSLPTAVYLTDPNTINKGADSFSVPTTGSFDIQFYFHNEFLGATNPPSGPDASSLNGHSPEPTYAQIIYQITGTGGFNPSASFFNALDSTGTWGTAAHIADIDEPGKLGHWSGWDGPSAVPEPATMFLLGSGLIGLAGIARKKFRK
jgi:hypothetical protein